MAHGNIRDIDQALGNPILPYAAFKTNSQKAGLLELDQHRNLCVTLYSPSGAPIAEIPIATSNNVIGAVKLVDENNNPYGVKHIDNKIRTNSMPYGWDIAEGNVPDHAVWRMSGAVQDVDNAYETIWSVGGLYVFPNTPMQMELVSSSIQDSGPNGANPAGTGVHYVLISYLDTNWEEQTEIVELDGTTVVTTDATDIYRINNFYTYPLPSIGSGKKAAGNIDLRHLANTPIYSRIPQGFNNQAQAVQSVPAGKTVYIASIVTSSGSDGGGHFVKTLIETTRGPAGSIPDIFYFGGLIATQDNGIPINLPIVGRFGEKTDIKVQCVADNVAANAEAATEYIGWIEVE